MRRPSRPTPLVEAWFDLLPPGQQPLARQIHRLVLGAAAQLLPAVRWGSLTYRDEHGPVLTIVPLRHHLQLQVVQGAALAAGFPELEGAARGMRHLDLPYRRPLDTPRLEALVAAAAQRGSVRSAVG
jgi:hypothetical protein